MYKPSPSHQLILDTLTEKNRRGFAIGGGIIQGKNYGTREGFVRPKKSTQKMTVNQALTEIFKKQTNFLSRQELKKLVDEKTGLNISIDVLKPTKYPLLKKATYRTSELMKQLAKENISKGKLTKKERAALALDKKEKRVKLFKDNLNVDIEIGPNNEVLGLDSDFKKKIDNAQVDFRRKKLNTKGLETLNDPKFFEFFKIFFSQFDTFSNFFIKPILRGIFSVSIGATLSMASEIFLLRSA